jgi:hypothetical protein
MSRPGERTPHRVDRLTLREKVVEGERLARELMDHMGQGFHPKLSELVRMVSPTDLDAPPTADITVRTQAMRVLDSEQFTNQLEEEAEKFFTAIAIETEKIAMGETK